MEDPVEQSQTPTTPVAQLPSAFSLFKPSYEALMRNIWTFLGLFLVPLGGLLLTIPLAVAGRSHGGASMVVVLVGLASGIFFLFTGAAMPYVQLKGAQGQQITLGEALRVGLKHFWRFWGASLLVGLLVGIGLLLLIVPGLFILQRFYLTIYYIYDQDMGVIEAMKKSAADAKQFSGAVWGLIGVNFLISLINIIPLFFLLVIILQLLYVCAPAIRYLQIKPLAGKQPSSQPQPTSPQS